MKQLPASLAAYLESGLDELKALLFRLCEIPAPSHHEEKRAAFCLNWLKENGIADAYIDEADNVVWPYNVTEGEKLLVFAAHTDTVFPDAEPFKVRVEGDWAYCPGIGDDTASAAELMMLMKYAARYRPETECGILFVLNSGEEGLGNLYGIRQIFKDFEGRVKEFISIDWSVNSVCARAVGSHRYRVCLDTEGGHSFGNFGNRNAIERMARLIARLYAVQVPDRPGTRTTYNVGGITGGTSVNTIAQHAEILYEYRSDSRDCLDYMKQTFERIIEDTRSDCKALSVELLGDRPCGAPVDPAAEKALTDRARDAMLAAHGCDASVASGSTDCNIPLSLGIPAVCIGGYEGSGCHTYEEGLNLANLPDGWKGVALVWAGYFKE